MTNHESWLTVTVLSTESVARASEIAFEKPFKSWVRKFKSLFEISDQLVGFFQQHRELAIPRLRQILGEKITDQAIAAAVLLVRLHENDALGYLLRVLQTGTVEQTQRVLWLLVFSLPRLPREKYEYCRLIHEETALVDQIYSLAGHPERKISESAVDTFTFLKFPGHVERLWRMFREPSDLKKDQILRKLSICDRSEELFHATEEYFHDRKNEWGQVSIYEEFIKGSKEPMKSKSIEKLYNYLIDNPDLDPFDTTSFGRSIALRTLSNSFRESELSWLRELLAREKPGYASNMFDAFVRLSPDESREFLLGWLCEQDDVERKLSVAVYLAGEFYQGTADPEIVNALIDIVETRRARQFTYACRSLAQIGGDLAFETIEKHGESLEPGELPRLRQLRSKKPVNQLLTDLTNNFLITKKQAREVEKRLQISPTETYFSLLNAAQVAFSIDLKAVTIPCEHDELVETFSRFSNGKFSPLGVEELWVESEDFLPEPYTLNFQFGDRVYSAKLRNLGRWYDAQRVEVAINRALADAGLTERYIGIMEEWSVGYVFADPLRFIPFAKKHHIPLFEEYTDSSN